MRPCPAWSSARRRSGAVMAGVDIWAAHFGFARTPFTKSVPADKLFERAAHAEAVARVNYCINQSALGVIVGDTGAGKTVAVRAAVASLDRTKYTVIYLANPSGGCRGLYVAIATALGATPRFHKAEAINQAAALLGAEEHERHRRVLLIIDLCSRWDYAALWAASAANTPEPASFVAGLRER